MATPEESLITQFKACLSSDTNAIKEATEQTYQMGDANFDIFLLTCSKIISNENVEPTVREMAGTFLRNFICYRHKGNWMYANEQTRREIKENLLNALGCNIRPIKNITSYALASIAKAELSVGQWGEIFQIIQNGIVHNNEDNKQVSLLLIQNILAEFQTSKDVLTPFLDSIYNMVFGFLVFEEIQTAPERFKLVLNCLMEFLPYLDKKFNDQNFKTIFFDFLTNCMSLDDEDIIKLTTAIISQSVTLYYDFVAPFMDNLLNGFISLLQGQNPLKSCQAAFFITDLAEKEKERYSQRQCSEYILSKFNQLIQAILFVLSNSNPEEEDPTESFSPYKAMFFVLDALAKCLPQQTVQNIFPFVANNLQTDNDKLKAIAVYAFMCILDMPEKQVLSPYVGDCICTMVGMMNNPLQLLQENVAQCIEKLCQYHLEAILRNDNALLTLINGLKNELSKRPYIKENMVHYMMVFHYMSTGIKFIQDPFIRGMSMSQLFKNSFSDFLSLIRNICLEVESYDKDCNVANKGFLCIGSMIENSSQADLNTIYNFVGLIFNDFGQLARGCIPEKDKKEDYQTYLCNVITALGNYRNLQLSNEQGENIFNLIIGTLEERGSLYEEAIVALSSILCILDKTKADELLDNFMKFLTFGLQSLDQEAICRSSLIALGDLVGAQLPKLFNYIQQIMVLLKGIINSNTNLQLKIHVVSVYSDCFFNYVDHYKPYVAETFTTVLNALGLSQNNDGLLDDADVESLRLGILDYFSSLSRLAVTSSDQDIINLLRDKVKDIVEFINGMCCVLNPTNEPKSMTMGGILCDFINLFGAAVLQYQNEESTKILLSVLRKTSPEGNDMANYLSHALVSLQFTMN
ncbi:MAG: hypothetical protein MJ252_14800 [archaeon]|nr:hypothetical protein [archaeon]